MIKYFDSVLRQTGGPYPDVVVTVLLFPSEALAPIYTDDGSGPIAGSTVTTDARGFFEFFCDPGRYILEFGVDNAIQRTIVNVDVGGIQVLEDLADDDVGLGASLVVLEDGRTVQEFADNPFTSQILAANGTAALPAYSFTSDSNTGMYRAGADQLGFSTAGLARAEIDASGRLLIGTGTALSVGNIDESLSQLVTEEADATIASINLVVFSTNSATHPSVRFGKSRGATEGVYTIVIDGQILGTVAAAGSDGVNLDTTGASLRYIVDGTPASNRIPTKFSFLTAAGVSDDDLSEKFAVRADGRVYGTALHDNSGVVTGTTNQYIASGTYTPTLTNDTNVTGSGAFACQWMRVGNVVTVSGRLNIDPTTTALGTTLGISLPIASNFVLIGDCGGAGSSANVPNAWAIGGNLVSDRADMVGVPTDISNQTVFFSFTYLVQ